MKNKVLKTEHDSIPEDPTFTLLGILALSSILDEVKDSMEEDIIEDSMNKDSEDSTIKNRVKQLEIEIQRLKNIISEERNKNRKLELSLTHFNKLYKRDSKDWGPFVFNKTLKSSWFIDQTRFSGDLKSENLQQPISPIFQKSKFPVKEIRRKSNREINSRSRERYSIFKENSTNLSSKMKLWYISQAQSSIQSPKVGSTKQNAKAKNYKNGSKKRDERRKTKSKKVKCKKEKRKLNQSMNSPNFHNQVTQETYPGKL